MGLGYIDLEEINHLEASSRGVSNSSDRLWRESYYFNMTDGTSGISLITTIGLLPNKGRTTGFVLIIRDSKVVLLMPLVVFGRAMFTDYRLCLKGLTYSVDGAGWRLILSSKRCDLDILFTPINRIHPYIKDTSDEIFSKIGSQHYEQFGTFEGRLSLDDETITIGPCLGHRDHSWGIRDWSVVERYRLLCCAFSERFAINLWEGRLGGQDFLKGYVFDGTHNIPIVQYEVIEEILKDRRRPDRAEILLEDQTGREYLLRLKVLTSVVFPPRGSILYETIAAMECDGMRNWGLVEYLYHERNPLRRAGAALNLLRML
jgi:hypothetical protein